jgi:hypothetical protein
MHAHHNSPDNPDGNRAHDRDDDPDAVVIPLPRKAPDDDIEHLPTIRPDQPVWWYDQSRKRGGERRYCGYVNPIRGAESERLRGELAQVIQELLDWAATQHPGDQSTEDGEAA